jgi:hypothetical protein
MGMALDNVEAPDVIGLPRPQANAGVVVEPQRARGLCLFGTLSPVVASDALQ